MNALILRGDARERIHICGYAHPSNMATGGVSALGVCFQYVLGRIVTLEKMSDLVRHSVRPPAHSAVIPIVASTAHIVRFDGGRSRK